MARVRTKLPKMALVYCIGSLGSVWLAFSHQMRAELLASSLPLEIRGVITSSDPMACVALLQDIDKGKLIAVKPGYFVYDKRAKVLSILSKTVILDRGNGTQEYLGEKPDASKVKLPQTSTSLPEGPK